MSEDCPAEALRVFMWIVPRSSSTAITKCMSFVDDTVVWIEPYQTCRMNETYFNPEFKKDDPGAERMRERLKSVASKEETIEFRRVVEEKTAQCPNLHPRTNFTRGWVKEQLEAPEPETEFIFIKDQAPAIFDYLDYLPERVPARHTFLIRHPREAYVSWKSIVTTMEDPSNPIPWNECHAADDAPFMPVPEFYQIQYKLWKHVKEHLDPDTIIIDAHDLSSNPDAILLKFFQKLGIPFKKSYLEWSGDLEAIFSSWRGTPAMIVSPAYTPITARAANSTKFEKPKNPRGVSNPEYEITEELKEYIEGALPLYEEMYRERLT